MNNYYTYFLHISSGTLAHIYVSGCIRPACIIDRRENDDQSLFPEYVLLSNKKWSPQNDCSLQIILTKEESERIQKKSEDYYLYDSIIPISRIIKILFLDNDKAETVLWNIKNGAGYIPQRIIFIESKQKNEIAKSIKGNSESVNSRLEETKKFYGRFNRLMGGIAFLRTSLNDYLDNNINYPINYISTLSFFSSVIKNEFENTNTPKDYKLHTFFNGQAGILQYLGKDISEDIINKLSTIEKITLTKKFGTYDLSSIPPNSMIYYLCILSDYGRNKGKSIEDFIIDFIINKTADNREALAIIMGIQNGYESIRNHYKIKDMRITVKFEMESKLDFYIVESLFFYLNKQKQSDYFEFIDQMNLKSDENEFNPDYMQYNILGTIVSVKKKDYIEFLSKLLVSFVGDITDLFPKEFIQINQDKLIRFLLIKHDQNFKKVIEELKYDIRYNLNQQKQEIKLKKEQILNVPEDNISTFKEAKNESYIKNKENADQKTQTDILLFPENTLNNTLNSDIIKSSNAKVLKQIAKENHIKIPKDFKNIDEIRRFLLSQCNH